MIAQAGLFCFYYSAFTVEETAFLYCIDSYFQLHGQFLSTVKGNYMPVIAED